MNRFGILCIPLVLLAFCGCGSGGKCGSEPYYQGDLDPKVKSCFMLPDSTSWAFSDSMGLRRDSLWLARQALFLSGGYGKEPCLSRLYYQGLRSTILCRDSSFWGGMYLLSDNNEALNVGTKPAKYMTQTDTLSLSFAFRSDSTLVYSSRFSYGYKPDTSVYTKHLTVNGKVYTDVFKLPFHKGYTSIYWAKGVGPIRLENDSLRLDRLP